MSKFLFILYLFVLLSPPRNEREIADENQIMSLEMMGFNVDNSRLHYPLRLLGIAIGLHGSANFSTKGEIEGNLNASGQFYDIRLKSLIYVRPQIHEALFCVGRNVEMLTVMGISAELLYAFPHP